MPTNAAQTRRAAIYLRISLDATGEGLAVDRQRQLCQAIAAQRGWQVVGEYIDNSISASDAKKNRPGYNDLVAAFNAGAFDALICYDLDRLTRQPRQLEDWIDAAEERGLALVTANGEADLQTDAGRLFARIKAAVARSEVERKSARQKAAARQRSDLGKPPLGVRLTGYTAKGETVPEEAEVVRRIFKLFDNGETLKSIARTLTDEGVTTRHGKPWNPSSVQGILKNPRYAGRAIYDGEVTGKPGLWEPLVDPAAFDLIQARLADPRRKTAHGTDRKHLGSGLFVCDECGEPVTSFSGGRYRCREAHINRAHGPVDPGRVRQIIADDAEDIAARGVDEYVLAVVAERLSRPDLAARLTPPTVDTAPLLAELKRLRQRLEAIDAEYDEGIIDGRRWRAATDKTTAELNAVDRQLAQTLPGSSALSEVIAAPDPVAAFLATPLMTRRSIIDALCQVRLKRGTRGLKRFNPNTIRIAWRTS